MPLDPGQDVVPRRRVPVGIDHMAHQGVRELVGVVAREGLLAPRAPQCQGGHEASVGRWGVEGHRDRTGEAPTAWAEVDWFNPGMDDDDRATERRRHAEMLSIHRPWSLPWSVGSRRSSW